MSALASSETLVECPAGGVSEVMVTLTFLALVLLAAALAICGFPSKAPQDPSVKDGCSRAWAIFMGPLIGIDG
eukprot:Skav234698  [mRNA]  locus=scaffold3643:194134:196603:- [translate_table: standard]